MTFFLLLAGILLLFKGADYFVAGSASIARRLGIPTLIIGLTVVAIGTSAPEFVVSFLASLKKANELAIGNIIGSNIANILVGLGIAAMITNLSVHSSTIWKEIPFAILACFILLVMMNDRFFNNGTENQISLSEGFLLLAFFIIFIVYTISYVFRERAEKLIKKEIKEETKTRYIESFPKALAAFFAGFISIIIGGKLLVESGIVIAKFFGVSEALIGLTVAAAGTSLPEIVTSATAAYRKETDIAIGNIVGSNIFNILFIGGAAALPHALTVSPMLHIDTIVMAFATILLFIFTATRKKIDRLEGIIFLLLYAGYLGYLIQRG